MDKPLWGLRVDGPLGRRFLRGLSLTRLWREGCGGAPLNYRRRLLMIKPLQPGFARGKTGQPPFRAREIPLWWLAPPPCPVGSMSLDSWVAYSSPMNPVPLPPPQFGGAAKGKRLNGQARRLTSPHLEVLCRTSTGDYKAPRSHVLISRSTLSTGCSAPACGGSPAKPERGRRAQRASQQNAFYVI